ncbi:MAG: hypothetical protein GKR96_13125 [Gammaproteobacteria bacterium]|nr:hypothetical protein [Gammaproteobacteria bacterium]
MFFLTDRITGLLIAIFGITLYWFIIPNYVDSSQSSWLRPDTIPNATCLVTIFCGLVLVIKPSSHKLHAFSTICRAGLFFMLLAVGLYVMSLVGFVYVAPILALSLMLTIGERRLFWLTIGSVAIPFTIWLLVVRVLERSLPGAS